MPNAFAPLRQMLRRLRGDHQLVAEASKLHRQLERVEQRLARLEGSITADASARVAEAGLLEPEFAAVPFARFALRTLLQHYRFTSVLDIGSGAGAHAAIFRARGKQVTGIDLGRSIYAARQPDGQRVIAADFLQHDFGDDQFDCIWASHVLEHQPNPNVFLVKALSLTPEGGIACITVPPLKHALVGGHVTLWNAGLLLYHLVLAGCDCRDAAVCSIGYDISVIVRKRSIELPVLAHDAGDIDRLSSFLPPGCTEGFDGRILAVNWPGLGDDLEARGSPSARACAPVGG